MRLLSRSYFETVLTSRRLVLLSLFVIPWTVLVVAGGTTLVFPWGLVNPRTLHVTTLPEYLFVLTAGLPEQLLSWPLSVLLYLIALASAFSGRFEDGRVTGGLLAIAGITHLNFALRFVGYGALVIPLGPIALFAVAWWFHWPDFRQFLNRR
ncbi:TIGR04206 family protein [Haladaptatus caseinilyticus]|uniref:TIGR04206 family protein n=1 Tax=Haladaptatus caseinilyticus TaxID=2993314 RepID=UPI00224A7C75|nr:TIGR04206 family protein [Haladaptatus caseinilyticus]